MADSRRRRGNVECKKLYHSTAFKAAAPVGLKKLILGGFDPWTHPNPSRFIIVNKNQSRKNLDNFDRIVTYTLSPGQF